MRKKFWVWSSIGALTALAIGFAAGAYVGCRLTSLFFVRRDVRAFGLGHDEFVWLGKYGSKDDIPSLLYGLKQQTNSEDCTHAHCLDALHTLSGASPGDSYSDWTNWWVREMKRPVPDWHPSYGLVPWKKFIKRRRVYCCEAERSQQIRPWLNKPG